MRRIIAAVCLAALLPAAGKAAGKKDTQSFAERLAAGKIVFAQAPIEPLPVFEVNENLNVTRIAEAEAVANDILARLIAAAAIPGARLPTFFITAGIEFNCSAVRTGGAISCSHHVLETLIGAGRRGEDQFAFLLAHELAHILIAEHRRRFERSDAVKSGWAKAGSLAGMIGLLALNRYSTSGNVTTVHPTMAANNVFFGMISAGADAGETVNGIVAPGWSRDDEAEADAFAIWLVQRAGYDPKEAAQLLGTLDAEQRGIAGAAPNGLLKKAADNLVTQAVLSRGNPISMGIGMGTGLLASIVTRGGKNHYHDDTAKRAAACAEQVAALARGGTRPDEARALFAAASAGETTPSTTPVVEVAAAPPPPSRRRIQRGRGRSSPPKGAVAAAVVPKDPWTLMTERSSIPLKELTMAVAVDQRRTAKNLPGALALCQPSRPTTRQLALACGTAHVAAENRVAAAALLRQAATDPTADVDTFRRAAQGQAALGAGQDAVATIAAGHKRYPDGQLYPAEIVLRDGLGDRDGARAAAQRCAAVPMAPIKDECVKVLKEMEATKKV